MGIKKAHIILFLVVIGGGINYFMGAGIMDGNQRIKSSPQHSDGVFINPHGVRNEFFSREAWDVGRKFLFEKRVEPRPSGDIPIHLFNTKDWSSSDSSRLRFSWLGHSSILIAMEGSLILADPVFENRASPFGWMGPERFFPSPVQASQMPPLDVVLITHDHYDHLEKPTIIALKDKASLFIVPLGIGDLLLEWGVAREKIAELDWWESHTHKNLKFTATPAVHYSSRGLLDFNKRLWVSWAINGPRKSAFISGDSGYFDAFKQVGEKLGPFDAAFLKIGAYANEGTWRKMHMTPEEAVAECVDLRGKLMIPHHWATFDLGLHPWKEPMERAVKSAKERGVRFTSPRPGEVVDAESAPEPEYWWEDIK